MEKVNLMESRKLDRIRSRFLNEKNVIVRFDEYHDRTTAIQLFTQDGVPLMTATVNLSAYQMAPKPGHVFIKEYAENEGITAALVANGIIGEPTDTFTIGYGCTVNHCKYASI